MKQENYKKANDKSTGMKTNISILNKVADEGYTENFQITANGLYAPSKERHYAPEDLKIVNFYRFESESDPDDSSILYIIETKDGVKGTLSDAYGYQADSKISEFVSRVENINKQ